MSTPSNQKKKLILQVKHYLENLGSVFLTPLGKPLLFSVLGILINTFILASSWLTNTFATLFFIVLLIVQVIILLKNIQKPTIEVREIVNAIKKERYSINQEKNYSTIIAQQLHSSVNQLLKKHDQDSLTKKEASLFFKNMLQHVAIGLITIDKEGNVELMNIAAKKLLQKQGVKHILELKSLSKDLVDVFLKIKTGGRNLTKLTIDGELVQLSIYAIELVLREKEYKMISIQNINAELEEMEMTAWQNLIRVLTHEIMNSITPISSLTATVEESINGIELKNNKIEINQEDREDFLLALHTIQRRSEGLIHFVKNFKNLTHISYPIFKRIIVSKMFEEIKVLLNKDILLNEIVLGFSSKPKDLTLDADEGLIEQVLINLIKNAIQAFDEEKDKRIEVAAYKDSKERTIISIKDNGCGIEQEALSKIFTPFFTTKKEGSGIGLNLSRQIMRKHKGSLTILSKIDEGTTCIMRF